MFSVLQFYFILKKKVSNFLLQIRKQGAMSLMFKTMKGYCYILTDMFPPFVCRDLDENRPLNTNRTKYFLE